MTGARGSRGVPVSLAATSAPSRVLFVLMVMEVGVAEPLSPLWMGEELLFWLGEVLGCFLFVMVAGFVGW